MKSTAFGRRSITDGEPVLAGGDARARADQPLQRRRQVRRVDAVHGDVAPGDRPRRTPRSHRPPGPRRCGASSGCSDRTPSMVMVLAAGTGDPGAHPGQHHREVDDLGLPGGVLDDRHAASQTCCHQQVLGRADAGELEFDLGARAARRRIRRRVRARSSSSRPAAAARSGACPAGRDPIASPPGSATRACRSRPISGPSTATEARSRLTAGKSATVRELGRRLDGHDVADDGHRAAESAQDVGHQRQVLDVGAVGQHRGALGQQRRRHQLQHAVLGPGDVHHTAEPGSPTDDELIHRGTVSGPDDVRPSAYARTHERAPDEDLHPDRR